MAKIQAPAGIEIAALRQKTQQQQKNLLAAGPGTPWEDRGSTGVVNAFFKTAVASLTAPGALLAAIRRPETTGDLAGLRIGNSLLWIVSAAVHFTLYRYLAKPDSETFFFRALLASIGAGGLAWLGFSVFAAIYLKLLSAESKTTVPQPLVHNIIGYCMGPSILAPIPVVGPVAALVAMMIITITAGGTQRLALRSGGAIITVLLTSFVTAVVLSGAGFALWYVLSLWLGA